MKRLVLIASLLAFAGPHSLALAEDKKEQPPPKTEKGKNTNDNIVNNSPGAKFEGSKKGRANSGNVVNNSPGATFINK